MGEGKQCLPSPMSLRDPGDTHGRRKPSLILSFAGHNCRHATIHIFKKSTYTDRANGRASVTHSSKERRQHQKCQGVKGRGGREHCARLTSLSQPSGQYSEFQGSHRSAQQGSQKQSRSWTDRAAKSTALAEDHKCL